MYDYIKPFSDESYSEYVSRIKLTVRDLTECKCVENHHILPKCLGGKNNSDNIVSLLPQEHYYAHKLLAKENPGERKLQYAWWLLASIKDDRNNYIKLSADEYAEVREIFINLISGENNANFGGLKQSSIDKIKATKKSQHKHYYNNGVSELLINEGNDIPENYVKGRLPMSNEQKLKISNSRIGMQPSNKGKRMTIDQKIKIACSKSKFKVIDNNTGVIYLSVKDASIKTGVSSYYILKQCENKTNCKTTKARLKYNDCNFSVYEQKEEN